MFPAITTSREGTNLSRRSEQQLCSIEAQCSLIQVWQTSDEYNIIKISEYREPELIHDYQTKNKINVNTFLSKYLSKQGVKMVSKLNNKIIVQNEEDINLFVLKSDNDALRFIESLTERFVKLKRGDCMFVNDSSAPQKKYLYNLNFLHL